MFNGSAISVQMLEGGIAEMNFDLQGESVNKFNSQTVLEFGEALELLEKADDVKGLLITSSKPVFIVGHARSGTTLMHRLMSADGDRFSYFLYWETFFPSLLQKKIIRAFGRIDSTLLGGLIDKKLKALRNARWEKAFQERDPNEPLQSDDINRKATIVIEHSEFPTMPQFKADG